MISSLGVIHLEQWVSCERVAGQWLHEHGNRYQATTDEDEEWEDLVRAVVNFRACEVALAL
jgi:hypothetical protein